MGRALKLGFLGLMLTGCLAVRNSERLVWVEGSPPRYPEAARAEGLEGVVLVIYDVDPEGRVRNPRVVRAEPPAVFDAAALDAVSTWRYKPFRRGGKPIAVTRVESTLRFELGEAYATQ
ncbi:MAG: energy transducer TonB [Pseudomonadales bacterium]|jgi:TonB family protein|nr:energy transducer TonB [Pseudomonadales bacterium]